MLNQLMDLLTKYRLLLMSGILVLLILRSKKRANGNRIVLILAGVLAGAIVYELVMDEPVTRLPARINQSLQQPGPTESTNPHYYVSPEKRYNLSPEER